MTLRCVRNSDFVTVEVAEDGQRGCLPTLPIRKLAMRNERSGAAFALGRDKSGARRSSEAAVTCLQHRMTPPDVFPRVLSNCTEELMQRVLIASRGELAPAFSPTQSYAVAFVATE